MWRAFLLSSWMLVLNHNLAPMACRALDPLFTSISNPVLENGSFVEFPALEDMRSAWGDFDRDGDLDVVIMGRGPSGPVTRLYRKRSGSMTFEEVTVVPPLPQLQDGALAWGDLDGDGDLDLAISGATSSSPTGPDQLVFRVL